MERGAVHSGPEADSDEIARRARRLAEAVVGGWYSHDAEYYPNAIRNQQTYEAEVARVTSIYISRFEQTGSFIN